MTTTTPGPQWPDREPSASEEGPGLSWAEVVVAVLRRRWLLVWVPFATFVLVVGVTIIKGHTYTSVALFYPQQSPGLSSRLAGLASQFGVSVPGQDPTLSPDMFSEIALSPRVLSIVAARTYEVPDDPRCPCTMAVYWELAQYAPPVALAKSVAKLRNQMTAVPGLQTGAVALTVSTPSARLSQQLAEGILQEVDRVNDSVRAVQAGAERRFVQGRLAVAESSLAVAEGRMQRFLEVNRQYQGSPALTFEWQRINREVSLRQDLFSSLSQEFENAGIEEVRNTPAIAVPQPATLPALADRRWLLLKGLAALILGALLAVGYALARSQMNAAVGASRPGPEELAVLVAEVRGELRALLGRVRFWRRRVDG